MVVLVYENENTVCFKHPLENTFAPFIKEWTPPEEWHRIAKDITDYAFSKRDVNSLNFVRTIHV